VTPSSPRSREFHPHRKEESPEVSAHSVQKELNILKHLLRLAVEWEIVPFNLSQGVKAPRVAAGSVRYLQPGELRAVLEASSEWLRPVRALAACNGMRRSELLGLCWLDVDIEQGRVMLPQTKNGEGRIVYLNETAKAAIRSLPLTPDVRSKDMLFQDFTGEQVSMAFARACKSWVFPTSVSTTSATRRRAGCECRARIFTP
jgi:integrase